MVYLPVSPVAARTGGSEPSRFAALVSGAAEFFRIIGAATRVAAAVEARRAPNPDDLATLGVNGKLPPAW